MGKRSDQGKPGVGVGRTSLKGSERFWYVARLHRRGRMNAHAHWFLLPARVTATVCLILFLVCSSQAFILIPYFVYHLPYSMAEVVWTLAQLLVPFNLGATLILTNYYRCVTMQAGSVPLDWQPPAEALSSPDTPPRYCRPCKAMKPPRAHHCRTCRQCVLRMDHHCPWIANCVGQANYASFIRFLAAVDATCAAHLVLCALRTADWWWVREGGRWRAPNTATMTLLVLNFGLCIPTFVLVGAFSIYHFWCLCTNTTTIEGWEKDKVEKMIRRQRIPEVCARKWSVTGGGAHCLPVGRLSV